MENKDNDVVRPSPLHKDLLKGLLQGNPEKPTTVDYKNVTITNKDGLSLRGLLVGQSIAIPTSPPQNSEKFIQDVVEANWETFLSTGQGREPLAFFRFLKTPMNTTKKGFNTMLSEVKGSLLIHIYPHFHVESQDDFVKAITETYANEGLNISIEK
jgi:hypothetical protein